MRIAAVLATTKRPRGAYAETRVLATLGGEPVAFLVERAEDGVCTVLRTGQWHAFSGEPEEWPSRRDAMKAVEVAVGKSVTWNELAHTRGRTELRRHEWRAI